ncbi:hypothetical protein [Tateyamaria sp. Alg231-49]|uniref:DUF4760 domain-containing protein n=1 Tax=Tateyamaria sp. Alg231-49 TaxID=1922219 RepID=UPI000D559843|nr:hypothetical protein [Tateyamaria sp. Alg231-49]
MSQLEKGPKIFGMSITFLEGLAAILTIAGSMGVFLAVWQYMQDARSLRVERTLDYIERWEEGSARVSFEKLSDALAQEFSLIPAEEKAKAEEDDEFRARLLAKATNRILREQQNEEAFHQVVYFFNSLGLCLEGKICDANTSKIFFKGTVNQFMEYFDDPLEEILASEVGYGSGLKLLATKLE